MQRRNASFLESDDEKITDAICISYFLHNPVQYVWVWSNRAAAISYYVSAMVKKHGFVKVTPVVNDSAKTRYGDQSVADTYRGDICRDTVKRRPDRTQHRGDGADTADAGIFSNVKRTVTDQYSNRIRKRRPEHQLTTQESSRGEGCPCA